MDTTERIERRHFQEILLVYYIIFVFLVGIGCLHGAPQNSDIDPVQVSFWWRGGLASLKKHV
jgi:hypothetical protein